VVAGVLYDAARRVLITQRPADKRHAGYWEFPGGKLQEHESESDGLARELREELDIEAQQQSPLLSLRHDYPDRSVLLAVWLVASYVGVPRGAEGQALRWVTLAELGDVNLLPADWPIVETLRCSDAAASKL
jgi:8-oxo-dGTP diphosphatase